MLQKIGHNLIINGRSLYFQRFLCSSGNDNFFQLKFILKKQCLLHVKHCQFGVLKYMGGKVYVNKLLCWERVSVRALRFQGDRASPSHDDHNEP